MKPIAELQTFLGVTADGLWGPKSQAALDAVLHPPVADGEHSGKASTFADMADVEAFQRCKGEGHSDQYCFRFGDNGIGCYGDNTAQEHTPMCAIIPEDMEARWGSVNAAKHQKVLVTVNGKTAECIVGDRMPRRANVKNGAVIDLNPATVKALGLQPPFMLPCVWKWA